MMLPKLVDKTRCAVSMLNDSVHFLSNGKYYYMDVNHLHEPFKEDY